MYTHKYIDIDIAMGVKPHVFPSRFPSHFCMNHRLWLDKSFPCVIFTVYLWINIEIYGEYAWLYAGIRAPQWPSSGFLIGSRLHRSPPSMGVLDESRFFTNPLVTALINKKGLEDTITAFIHEEADEAVWMMYYNVP